VTDEKKDIDEQIDEAFMKFVQDAKLAVLDRLRQGKKLDLQEIIALKMLFPEIFSGSVSPFDLMKFSKPSSDEQDEIDKVLSKMAKALMLQMMRQMVAPQQMPMYPVITEYEPVLGKDGKPLTDATGAPILRVVQKPVITMRQQQRESKGESKESGLSNVIVELLKTEKERAKELEAKFLEAKERELQELKEQIQYLYSKDPLDIVKNSIATLKELGVLSALGGQQQPFDREIEKMRLDLEKWKAERDFELRKWLAEREDKKMEREEAKERVAMLGELGKEAIRNILAPVAERIGEGIAAGRAMIQQQAAQSEMSLEERLQQMAPEEKEELLRKIEEAKRELEETERRLKESGGTYETEGTDTTES